MEEWIRDLVNRSLSGVRALVDAVWERLAWLFGFILNILIALKNAWGSLLIGAVHGLNKFVSLADQTFRTLYWIVRIRIPAAISSAINDMLRWTLQVVNAAREYARQLYNDAIRWTVDQVNKLRSFADSIARWAFGKVTELGSALAKVATLVYMLLTSPARLAVWLIDAMIAELMRYVDRNFERIFTYARGRAILYTFRLAGRLEDAIRRLL